VNTDALEEIDPNDSARLTQLTGGIRELARSAVIDLRRLVFDLRPIALDDLGLAAALRAYANRRLAERGVHVSVETIGMKDRLPSQLETALFRVLQEAINNVAKHARATSVRIELLRMNQDLAAVVLDDGIGFDPSAIHQPTHTGEALGLLGIRERVEMLGGSLNIDSSPGAGTRVHLRVPLADLEGRGL